MNNLYYKFKNNYNRKKKLFNYQKVIKRIVVLASRGVLNRSNNVADSTWLLISPALLFNNINIK